VVLLSSAPRPRSRSGQANPTVTHPMPVAGPIPRQQFPSPLSNKSADHDTAMGCGRRRRPPACKTLTLEYKYLPPTKQVSSPSTLHYVLSGMSLSGCLALDLSAQPTLDSDFPTPAAACEERSQPRPNASYEPGHGNHSCTYNQTEPELHTAPNWGRHLLLLVWMSPQSLDCQAQVRLAQLPHVSEP
jgi:hypothetical protein